MKTNPTLPVTVADLEATREVLEKVSQAFSAIADFDPDLYEALGESLTGYVDYEVYNQMRLLEKYLSGDIYDTEGDA